MLQFQKPKNIGSLTSILLVLIKEKEVPNLCNCIPLFGTLPFSLPMPVRLLEYGILYGLTLRASRCLLESRKKLFHHNFHITAWQVKVSN